MTYREHIEQIVNRLQNAADLEPCVTKTTIAHYGPRLIDFGIDLDRLHAENERLTAIIDLVDMMKERDEMKVHIHELNIRIRELSDQ